MTVQNNSPIIWYIPGLFSGDSPQEVALMLLHKIYPNAEVIDNVCWENQGENNVSLEEEFVKLVPIETFLSNIDFRDIGNPAKLLSIPVDLSKRGLELLKMRLLRSMADAEKTSEWLANRIANKLSLNQRKKLILIGHSLGGYIIIRTLAKLYKRNTSINNDLSIHSAVLLGAAIDNMDPDILLSYKATQDVIYSMVNPDDLTLQGFQLALGKRALGVGCGFKEYNFTRYKECITSKSIEHSGFFYLSQWAAEKNIPIDIEKNPIQFLEEIANFLDLKKSKMVDFGMS